MARSKPQHKREAYKHRHRVFTVSVWSMDGATTTVRAYWTDRDGTEAYVQDQPFFTFVHQRPIAHPEQALKAIRASWPDILAYIQHARARDSA